MAGSMKKDKTICYKCIQKQGLLVEFPHILDIKHECSFCGSEKESWLYNQVMKQQPKGS